ncbi:hypothetical protein L207DRAFT_519839, partial [Hyaloscypha variabilis F]
MRTNFDAHSNFAWAAICPNVAHGHLLAAPTDESSPVAKNLSCLKQGPFFGMNCPQHGTHGVRPAFHEAEHYRWGFPSVIRQNLPPNWHLSEAYWASLLRGMAAIWNCLSCVSSSKIQVVLAALRTLSAAHVITLFLDTKWKERLSESEASLNVSSNCVLSMSQLVSRFSPDLSVRTRFTASISASPSSSINGFMTFSTLLIIGITPLGQLQPLSLCASTMKLSMIAKNTRSNKGSSLLCTSEFFFLLTSSTSSANSALRACSKRVHRWCIV